MKKNNEMKLHPVIEKALKTIPNVKELVNDKPELGSFLTQLGNNLDDAVKSIYEAYGILDIVQKNLSTGKYEESDGYMTSETNSIEAVKKILYASTDKVSDTADLMHYVTMKKD